MRRGGGCPGKNQNRSLSLGAEHIGIEFRYQSAAVALTLRPEEPLSRPVSATVPGVSLTTLAAIGTLRITMRAAHENRRPETIGGSMKPSE